MLPLLLGAALALSDDACSTASSLSTFVSDPVQPPGCATPFADEDALLSANCIAAGDALAPATCAAIRKQWWRAAKAMAALLSDADRNQARRFAMAYKDGAASVAQLALAGGAESVSVVVPAVQWAQTKSVVHVLVRFSPKKHGPVSVATVDEPDVALNATHLRFSATARPSVNSGKKPLRFELCIALDKPIDPAASTHSLASSGRLTLQLAKATTGGWERLAPKVVGAEERRSFITSWFEMQETLDRQGGVAAPPCPPGLAECNDVEVEATKTPLHRSSFERLRAEAHARIEAWSAPLRKKLRPHWKRAVKRLKGWELDVTVVQLEIAALALVMTTLLLLGFCALCLCGRRRPSRPEGSVRASAAKAAGERASRARAKAD